MALAAHVAVEVGGDVACSFPFAQGDGSVAVGAGGGGGGVGACGDGCVFAVGG